ncbi:MAG: hypothetical protein KAS67_02075 [Thermoplasmata archaeon]|nr:hypothetical protein [Thermoplasmata archaeon]
MAAKKGKIIEDKIVKETKAKKTSGTKSKKKVAEAKPKSKPKAKKESPVKAKKTSQTKLIKEAEPKKSSAKKTASASTEKPEPTLKSLSTQMARMEKRIAKQEETIKTLKETNREAGKKISGLEKKLETRIKREEVMMEALGLNSRSKKGSMGVLGDFNSSLLKVEEYLLNTGDRIDNILSAVKNHREFLVKLNKRVYKVNTRDMLELQLDIISNTLSIMVLSGFGFDKSLLKDVEKLRKMMDKKDSEIAKIKKKMNSLEKKFDEELERFDFGSIYEKKTDIAGYH